MRLAIMDTSLVKIDFHLDPQDWHGESHEGLWAEPLGGAENSLAFRLQNSPFYMSGISYMDVVEAYPTDVPGRFKYSRIIQKSGHSTYWIIVDKANSDFPIWWSRLQDLGCTYEFAEHDQQRRLYSVDVPETSDVYAVYQVLIQGKKELIWMVAEGDVGHDISRDVKAVSQVQ
jgi:hypothetical protein